LVQRATVEVLNAIYETDLLGFSYGFRPGRSPHKALQAVEGHIRYYGVPTNYPALALFRNQVERLWRRALSRRSQQPMRWERARRIFRRWLPKPRICHPYPLRRLGVIT
jgi:RNA-directed DNA polymerase